MNLDFNVLVFLTAFIFALPIIGYLFRFNIPISIFFLLAGTFMIAIFLATDGIIIDDRISMVDQSDFTNVGNTTTIYHYDVSSSTSDGQLKRIATETFIRAEYADSSSVLLGKEIQCIDIMLRESGTLVDDSELLQVGIWNSSNNENPQVVFGTMNTSMLTTSNTFYSFCRPDGNEHIMNVGDAFGVKWNYSGAIGTIQVRVDANNPFDSTNTYRRSMQTNAPTTWVSVTTSDLTARAYDIVPIPIARDTYSYEDNVMDISFTGENFQLKVIMIFISVMFLVGGALVEVRQR